LKHLRDIGNSVLVVEHDEDAIRAADYVVDMGPGAGVHGGEVVAEGTPEEIRLSKTSLTGAYLSGKRSIAIPKKRRARDPARTLVVKNARGNNLKNVTLNLPVGCRLHHRRIGIGQVHAHQRHALRGRRAPSLRLQRRTGSP
jgi:Excinuclease ATPase subunit